MSNVLDTIVHRRRQHVAAAVRDLPLTELRSRALQAHPAGGFCAALAGGKELRVIAELKSRSPSAGEIRNSYHPRQLAAELAGAGAAALSVLTEEEHFGGSGSHLQEARQGAPYLPLLRKDFIIDPWQIWEARLLGADAVLLIASLLPPAALKLMLQAVRDAGLEALVETTSSSEIDAALVAGAQVIGVNARDLKDFSVDLRRAEALAATIPSSCVRVAESGVAGAGDLRRLWEAGFNAALVGTSLMKAPSPGSLLGHWLRRPGAGDPG